MRRLLTVIIISISLFSCSKEKQPNIVGRWKEIAYYRADNSGTFHWTYVPENFAWYYHLSLLPDGTWGARQEYGAGCGTYHFDRNKRELTRVYTPSGDTQVTSVSYLDEDYLVFDNMSNGVLLSRQKFERE